MQLYGYGGRISTHKNTASLFSYPLSSNGVFLTPALYVVTSYMTLSRLICALAAENYALYNIFLHPFAKFPGPKSWAALRLFRVWSLMSGNNHHMLREVHEKYGLVVRVAPNELCFIDGEVWHDIFAGSPGNDASLGRAETMATALSPARSAAMTRCTFRDGHDGNKSVDIVEWLHWFAFDLAGELAFTESYG
ncbi:hypothetical protein BJX68DRAFT_268897 [Aspergillus pseudodeflectus]|uniref:Uncharacterized protein n=1 Tax=Aspergillus pseudodeflectus TaxID=176178 RepID=A0ABR4K133_9EURO